MLCKPVNVCLSLRTSCRLCAHLNVFETVHLLSGCMSVRLSFYLSPFQSHLSQPVCLSVLFQIFLSVCFLALSPLLWFCYTSVLFMLWFCYTYVVVLLQPGCGSVTALL